MGCFHITVPAALVHIRSYL